MGSIYKLRPEIREFIITEKKRDPYLSCRGIAQNVNKTHNIEVSKSSVHAILKAAGIAGPEPTESVSAPAAAPMMPEAARMDQAPERGLSVEPVVSVSLEQSTETVGRSADVPAAESPAVEPAADVPAPESPAAEPAADASAGISLPKAEAQGSSSELPPSDEPPAAPAAEPAQPPVAAPELQPQPHLPEPVAEEPRASPVSSAARERIVETPLPPAVESTPLPLNAQRPVTQDVPSEPMPEAPNDRSAPQPPPQEPVSTLAASATVQEPAVPALEDYRATACSGLLLLKAIDSILGGIDAFTEAARLRSRSFNPHLREQLETLLCVSVLRTNGQLADTDIEHIRAFVGKKIGREFIAQAQQDFQGMPSVIADILNLIPSRTKDVRCLRGTLADGQIFSLDGQMHTVWSTLNIPYDFASTSWRIGSHLAAVSSKAAPCILSMAPGYDMPSKEFFAMYVGFDGRENPIEKCALYGNQFEEMEVFPFPKSAKFPLIFGIWPWQFTGCRKVHSIGEFKPLAPGLVPKECGSFEVAEIGLDLTQPSINKSIALRGAALRLGPAEKIWLLILTNQPVESFSPERLANLYLRKWPNLDEGFQDYSRKIELFTYRGSGAPRIISSDSVRDYKEPLTDILGSLGYYARVLDIYARWHLLPPETADKTSLLTRDVLSGFKGAVTWSDTDVSIQYTVPPSAPFASDVPAILRRLNESGIRFFSGRQAWFRSSSA